MQARIDSVKAPGWVIRPPSVGGGSLADDVDEAVEGISKSGAIHGRVMEPKAEGRLVNEGGLAGEMDAQVVGEYPGPADGPDAGLRRVRE